MFSTKVILLFCISNVLFILLSGSKQEGHLVQSLFSVSVCSSLLKRTSMDPNTVLEDYEQFLAVMFRNSSDIGLPSVSFAN